MAKATAVGASRREQRRLQHQDLSRGQLLDAAEEVFGRKGFHDTTLREVAELAEFSVGSVYSFFESKDDLFLQVFLRRGGEFMPAMREVLASKAKPMDQLRALVRFQVTFFRQHPHFGRVYLRHSTSTMLPSEEIDDPAWTANYDEAMHLEADLFVRGQRSKQFRAGDPAVLGRLFSGLVQAYQAVDPAVISDDADAGERLPLVDFEELVASAFAAR
jgi:AcrR family transcriptional regulator